MKITLTLAFTVFIYLFSTAQTSFELIEKVTPQEGKVLIPYEKYRLPANDLTLIIHEDHSDPIVRVQVDYHVGSAREGHRTTGFAHFFEHMMFQGSRNVSDEEHFKLIAESGGVNNAGTIYDHTIYFQTAPSNMTETMIWMEADRMGTLLEGFNEKKFENQRSTVKNEKKQRNDNQPYGMVNEILFKSLFPNHPYESTPIGYVDDLDIATYDDLRNFFLRWYGPNNATLVVSGDVKPEEVKAWVEKYFKGIAKCPKVTKMYPKKSFLSMDYYVKDYDNIFAPLTIMAFPTVPEYHPDEAPLEVLAEIIGGGNNSLLYKNLVKKESALQAVAFNNSLELAGFLTIQAITKPTETGGLSEKDIEEALRNTLKDFETRGVSEEDLEVVKKRIQLINYSVLNSIDSKSSMLSHYHMMKGNGYNLQDDIDRYNSVTKEDVYRVYQKYIKNKKAVILRVERDKSEKDEDDDTPKSVNPHANEPKRAEKQYEGLTYTPPQDDFDRSIRPIKPKAKAFKIPGYYTNTFDNGLKIIGTESRESPLVYLYLEIEGGQLLESDKKLKSGIARLTSSMMGEGTQNLTTEVFSRELEKLGSRIRFNSGTQNSSVFITCLKKNLDQTLVLFQDALLNPRFDKDDFKRIKNRAIENLKSQKTNSSVLASKAWNSIVYKGTVLENYVTGDYKSLSKISLDEVIDFYNTYYSPNVSTLVISGNISQSEAVSKLGFLKEWKNTNVSIPSIPELAMPESTTIYLVDKPYAAQSSIWIGHPAPKYDYNGDHFKGDVMNFQLGGTFGSRIQLNLREDKGFTYGAGTGFAGNKHFGIFRFQSEIKKEATDSAIREVMYEINNYLDNGITQEELDFTKSSITLSEALDYETPFQKLNFLSTIAEYDLPRDYTTQQASIVNAMTVSDVNAIAKKLIKPDNMVIIVVGHAYKIREGLNNLGYGKIKEIKVE